MEQSDRDQSETDQTTTESFTPQAVRAAVGRWSVDRYIRLVRPVVLVAGVTAIILVLFRVNQIAIVVLQAGACVWVGLTVSRRGGRQVEAMTAGAMSGLALGLMTGLSRFVLEPSGYWVINILYETIIFGLVGVILCLGTLAASRLTKNSPT